MIGFIGEALIDLIAQENNNTVAFKQYIGGCALNSAIATARLKGDALFIGKISKDFFGKQIENYLIENNVNLVDSLLNSEKNSSLAFACLDQEKKCLLQLLY